MQIRGNFPEGLINDLKQRYIDDSGQILFRALSFDQVCKQFPEFKHAFEESFPKDQFREVMFCLLRDIDEIPVCPVCGKPLKLRNYIKGFNHTCSRKCANIAMSQDKEHIERHIEKLKMYFKDHHVENDLDRMGISKYEKIKGSWYVIHNYCKHGDLTINMPTVSQIYKRGCITLCPKCAKEIYENYSPLEEEISDFQNAFNQFFEDNKHNVKFSWFIRYYPVELKILVTYFERHFEKFKYGKTDFAEVMYVFRNKMTERPKCPICGKDVKFIANGYRVFCEKHSDTQSISGIEVEIRKFVSSLAGNCKFNNQSLIGKELDIYIEKAKLAIEINGCWWHSSVHKSKQYHIDKSKRCKKKGIFLMHIWEDDWLERKEVVKYEIKKHLGLADIEEIDLDKCETRKITHKDASLFYKENSLNIYLRCKTDIGLFYREEMIGVISATGKTALQWRFKKGKEGDIRKICKKIEIEKMFIDIEHDNSFLSVEKYIYKEKIFYVQRKSRLIKFDKQRPKCYPAGFCVIDIY